MDWCANSWGLFCNQYRLVYCHLINLEKNAKNELMNNTVSPLLLNQLYIALLEICFAKRFSAYLISMYHRWPNGKMDFRSVGINPASSNCPSRTASSKKLGIFSQPWLGCWNYTIGWIWQLWNCTLWTISYEQIQIDIKMMKINKKDGHFCLCYSCHICCTIFHWYIQLIRDSHLFGTYYDIVAVHLRAALG